MKKENVRRKNMEFSISEYLEFTDEEIAEIFVVGKQGEFNPEFDSQLVRN